MRLALALAVLGALVFSGGGESAIRKNWIPARIQHRIATDYSQMTYSPKWLRSSRLRYIAYDHSRKKDPSWWSVNFEVLRHRSSNLWMYWTVARTSPSSCDEMPAYAEATYTVNGVTVYWWAANGEETASRCVTGRGEPISITAGTSVAGDEQLRTPKSRRHARALALAIAYAARFPTR